MSATTPWTTSTCDLGTVLDPDDDAAGGADEYSCSFTADFNGNAGDDQTDTVTGVVTDDDDDTATDDDDATVSITVWRRRLL